MDFEKEVEIFPSQIITIKWKQTLIFNQELDKKNKGLDREEISGKLETICKNLNWKFEGRFCIPLDNSAILDNWVKDLLVIVRFLRLNGIIFRYGTLPFFDHEVFIGRLSLEDNYVEVYTNDMLFIKKYPLEVCSVKL